MAVLLDQLIIAFDRSLRVLVTSQQAGRATPGGELRDLDLSERDRRFASRLMRINHTGEVCAQALYQGQALTARQTYTRDALKEAAQEELDHLAWCETRIKELGGRVSYLNPVWYTGAFLMGISAGIAGDGWNLAFLKETEKQVELHLNSHLEKLNNEDLKTRAIIEVMRKDEQSHAKLAESLGAFEFPEWIKRAMAISSKLMTKTVYWV
ncbi:MAG: demethoxyubiquinone hydroxylase family protein [Ferrovum sp. 37-45-19]|jgi:ubiquinone biosynthesis monooxygenase Coq7|uniref:2-polyprenyl-3-methyl-6-methoxy-1,4-benzoquinone monooxygenase n=1 Tax=Ferrovum sp. JA12 TaxID=1356299 RepID=UPI00070287B3|nr:2-polyprenyl-3-methyl-6-methoxy-1,4-benzoquinone monooxygenase [Ferrovum sp. JA12]OYV79717.1 MAG: demethoxyubiquinone hydroxylase family protein [Ferrovum sp. 21-44-67]OYV94301.1 MAG: demethoxyubiquinone hydroxylase family protein [Ferrovum sp. 37-45-19]OZB32398.1 MAG: demethoxyubiquinone hydroxylase family protein [Ferrovum sp. 34-44-207]HQT80555.1 2-polyprenyl-3-methyl-6-methoxy-1,4-benzoquinone monooxygenase [Ferrovaceae bacterium]KRH79644.1 2-nonaprenyl-3-methyl-6-methoxy-1,4-benzoquino